MIGHLVKFNNAHSFRPTSFSLPTVEDLAFLIQVHIMSHDHMSLGGGKYLNFLSDPFLVALQDLRPSAGPGEELVVCHVDLTNAFWSLHLPKPLFVLKQLFAFSISGSFLSVFVFVWRVLRVSTNQDGGHRQWGWQRP